MRDADRARSPQAALAAVLLAGLWLAVGWLGVPRLISAAYHRASIPFINDLITGQNNHAVEFYLDRWADARGPMTVGVLLLLALLVTTRRWHSRVRAWAGESLRRAPTGGAMTLAVIGAVVGWVGGLLEAARRLNGYFSEPSGPGLELWWMSPTAGAAAGAALGLTMAAAGGRRPPSLRWATAFLVAVVCFSLIRTLGFGIHPLAGVVLAVGIACQAGALVAGHHERVLRAARIALPIMLLISVAVAAGLVGAEKLHERRALDSLEPADRGAPNVLLLVMDTQRASRMSLYGHTRTTTPNIDAFAAGAVVFDYALSTTSWTLPGHASMLTGRWASELRADWSVPLDDADPTLAEVLAEQGYATGAFIGNTYFASARSGLARGFSVYRDHAVTAHDWATSTWLTNRAVLWGRRLYGQHRRARKRAPDVNRQFLTWLDGVDRPFFAMLNYFDVHDRFDAPPPFDTIYRDPAPRFWLPNWFLETRYSPGDVAEMLDAYDSSVRYLDHHIGALLTELERREVLERTVVVITSDHGEHFGEREIVSHGNSLYRPNVQVPLVISGPGVMAGVAPSVAAAGVAQVGAPVGAPVGARGVATGTRGGVRASTPVSVRDIPATVLYLAGVPGAPLPGSALLTAHTDPDGRRRWAPRTGQPELVLLDLTARSFFMPQDPVRFGAMRGAVSDSLHYIIDGRGEEELYAFDRDPAERHNLVQSEPHRTGLEQLRGAVRSRPCWR